LNLSRFGWRESGSGEQKFRVLIVGEWRFAVEAWRFVG